MLNVAVARPPSPDSKRQMISLRYFLVQIAIEEGIRVTACRQVKKRPEDLVVREVRQVWWRWGMLHII